MKSCIKLGKSSTEILNILRQGYNDETISRTQCFKLHGPFKSGRTSLEEDESSVRRATSVIPGNVEKIHRLVHEDCRRTINGIGDVVGLSCGPMQAILTSGFVTMTMRPVTDLSSLTSFLPRIWYRFRTRPIRQI
ncbi:protein GVQW3-like [Octopus bimaculoides]|uniref:protein GVQW3-like n=1 Tax=Octopus bimaculoides TaxID=37653 RepID=UPI00071C5968|nr:protein GVQW3-like [Octopus bimaculoides]|eukprot:XP_014788003.1 PREDICTED: putative uncharacterized protein FLJ37770 [Octopus bimaculoides]